MMTQADCSTLSWKMIRGYLVRRKWLRGRVIDSDTFDAICDGRTDGLSNRLQREMSLVLAGYLLARSGTVR